MIDRHAPGEPEPTVHSGRLIGAIVWATRVSGLVAVAGVALPPGRRLLRPSVASWLGLPYQATIAALVTTAVAGVGLLCLATGLRRRKRRAWQLALGAATVITVVPLAIRHAHLPTLLAAAVVVLLIANREAFTALPDPVGGRWRAVRVFTQFALAGIAINVVVLTVATPRQVGYPGWAQRIAHAALALVGVSGPISFRAPALDDLTATIGLVFGLTATLLAGYLLLRSAEPRPSTSAADHERLLVLLDRHGHRDSLGYCALRPDKSVVFSPTGKAAVSYRVLAGVALACGDPLGDPEAWPGAINAHMEVCARHGWVPAVLGCSELGATVWTRHGLRVLELGDEAVVDVASFTLDGRAMRGVRQMASRAARAGHQVRVRRADELDPAERDQLASLADRWRGRQPERGFSMALGRLAHHTDPDCVLVTAERDGHVVGVLQFVPWGIDGLSLDLMRREANAEGAGLNELMITELLTACGPLGIRRVSLNFAAFRAALAQGQRLGAGPFARLSAAALHLGSRWWQIDSLYRFNAKFHPQWTPRYLAYPTARDLPRITLAALEAEGFGGRPPALRRATTVLR
ncbi:MAG: phosphatidylglycerol lysyltransferase domain-containing protein [Labedaea sp.]